MGVKRRLSIVALAVIVLGACAHQVSKPVIFTYHGTVHESDASSGPYRSYPVSAALGRGGPALTHEQDTWIAKIVRSRNYRWERTHLRFAVVDDLRVPIVVYRAHMEKGVDRGGLIIGESCNAYFDPSRFGFVTTPGDVGCEENAKPVE